MLLLEDIKHIFLYLTMKILPIKIKVKKNFRRKNNF